MLAYVVSLKLIGNSRFFSLVEKIKLYIVDLQFSTHKIVFLSEFLSLKYS